MTDWQTKGPCYHFFPSIKRCLREAQTPWVGKQSIAVLPSQRWCQHQQPGIQISPSYTCTHLQTFWKSLLSKADAFSLLLLGNVCVCGLLTDLFKKHSSCMFWRKGRNLGHDRNCKVISWVFLNTHAKCCGWFKLVLLIRPILFLILFNGLCYSWRTSWKPFRITEGFVQTGAALSYKQGREWNLRCFSFVLHNFYHPVPLEF